MPDLAHQIALLEMRSEQIRLHLRSVRAGKLGGSANSLAARNDANAEKMLEQFTFDKTRNQKGATFH